MKQTALFNACLGRDKMNRKQHYEDMQFKIIRIRKDGTPYANEKFDRWNAFATREEAEKRITELRQLNPHQKYELKF